MLHEVPSRLTTATLFPRTSARLLECWRAGEWLVEHGDVARFRSIAGIAELGSIDQVLALGPAKISAYGVSSTKIRVGDRSVRGYRAQDLHDPWSRYLSPTAEAEQAERPEHPRPQAPPFDVTGTRVPEHRRPGSYTMIAGTSGVPRVPFVPHLRERMATCSKA